MSDSHLNAELSIGTGAAGAELKREIDAILADVDVH